MRLQFTLSGMFMATAVVAIFLFVGQTLGMGVVLLGLLLALMRWLIGGASRRVVAFALYFTTLFTLSCIEGSTTDTFRIPGTRITSPLPAGSDSIPARIVIVLSRIVYFFAQIPVFLTGILIVPDFDKIVFSGRGGVNSHITFFFWGTATILTVMSQLQLRIDWPPPSRGTVSLGSVLRYLSQIRIRCSIKPDRATKPMANRETSVTN